MAIWRAGQLQDSAENAMPKLFSAVSVVLKVGLPIAPNGEAARATSRCRRRHASCLWRAPRCQWPRHWRPRPGPGCPCRPLKATPKEPCPAVESKRGRRPVMNAHFPHALADGLCVASRGLRRHFRKGSVCNSVSTAMSFTNCASPLGRFDSPWQAKRPLHPALHRNRLGPRGPCLEPARPLTIGVLVCAFLSADPCPLSPCSWR
jgi:hypothetical protein